MLTPTLALDDLFDPAKGWPFAAHQVPLERTAAPDGNPLYSVKVDGIVLIVFEQSRWHEDIASNVSPTRLVIMTYITGVSIDNPAALAQATSDSKGLPALGLDEDGDVVVTTAIPFEEGFPVDLLRKQAMVAMGIVAEQTAALIRAFNAPGPGATAATEADWQAARGVAGMMGVFLRAFLE